MFSIARPIRLTRTHRPLIALLALASATITAGAQTTQASSMDGAAQTTKAVAMFQSCAKPVWPAQDLQAGHQGAVTLSFLVGANGKVQDSKILKSSGYAKLDEAARVGIAKCQFKPATRNGQPVDSWTPIQYVWTQS